MQAPCKDCTDRQLGCHSVCEKYKEYAKHNEERRKLREKYNLENNLYWDTIRKGRRMK